jgi:hypothetical protein
MSGFGLGLGLGLFTYRRGAELTPDPGTLEYLGQSLTYLSQPLTFNIENA